MEEIDVNPISEFTCNPLDPTKKVEIHFDVKPSDQSFVGRDSGRGKVTVDCKCSMRTDDTSLGYPESILGTVLYGRALQAEKMLMTRANCHTLDRYNIKAQRDDSCGVGQMTEEWRYAVDFKFNMTHWPYIQSQENYRCVRGFFADSYMNMSLKNAMPLTIKLTAFLVGAVTMAL
jgi:hypothetical protein